MQILRILKAAGGWNHGLSLRIDNAPYLPLCIEVTDESGPCGLPALSVAHYGGQNGDTMRNPEMMFELRLEGREHLDPFFWRNNYVGVEQWSRFITEGQYVCRTELYRQQEEFAKQWDMNLRFEGFAHPKEPLCGHSSPLRSPACNASGNESAT